MLAPIEFNFSLLNHINLPTFILFVEHTTV